PSASPPPTCRQPCAARSPRRATTSARWRCPRVQPRPSGGPSRKPPPERRAIEQAAARALVTSFRWTNVLAALLAAAAALVAALLIEPVPSRAPAGDAVGLVTCGHLELVLDPAPRGQGCEDCLRLGERWVHLRMCLTCGYVGCCDASR